MLSDKICLVYLMDTQTYNAKNELVANVGIVAFGEKGYYRSDYGLQAESFVNERNANMGLSQAQAEAMVVCSMSGNWSMYDVIVAKFEKVFAQKALKMA